MILYGPKEGSFVGYKIAANPKYKAFIDMNEDDRKGINPFVMVKLEIHEDALRSGTVGSNKCRCNKCKVLDIYDINNKDCKIDEALSCYNLSFSYHIGEELEIVDFDKCRYNECSQDIHFFMTEKEALEYYGFF